MIIYIDRTIGVHGAEHGLTDDERVLFEQLAIANKYGKCLLCGDLSSIEWLMKGLEDWHANFYRKVYSEYSQAKSIILEVETLLVLSYSDAPVLPDFVQEKYRLLTVGEAVNYGLSQPCSMVAENLSDCAFYKLIADKYRYSKGIKGIQLAFRDELGGGDTLNTVFEKCISTDRVLTLGLMDSDIKYGACKDYPQYPEPGETAKKLKRKHTELSQKYNPATFDYCCLEVHELENLIPFCVLEELAQTTVQDMMPGVEYLKKILASEKKDAVLLYDFKEGGKNVRNTDKKYDHLRAYWLEVADTIGDDSFPGLCKKVLEKAIEIMSVNQGNGELYVTSIQIESYLQPIWHKVGKKVLSWGCANKPDRA